MNEYESDNSNYELSNLLSGYNDKIVESVSSLEDGECESPVDTLEQENVLREKLLQSLTSRKRRISSSNDFDKKFQRLDSSSIGVSNFKSKFDSSDSSSDNSDAENLDEPIHVDPMEYVSKQSSPLNYNPTDSRDLALPDSSEDEYEEHPIYYPASQGSRLSDRYQILNRVEEGTFGVVFRARDVTNKKIYALKRLKLENERSEFGFPITSIREVNTLMKARHRNVVRIREVVVGRHLDSVYLVMDFVEHDLKSFLKVIKRPLEIAEVKCLMLQLLAAVAHIHDNWIIHRDLKTSNLLLSHSGVLKVADFGLAREYGSPLKCYTAKVVTVWYRAPELLLGQKLYSTNIDMWSVGCIFGELLLSRPLFKGNSEKDQIYVIFCELGVPNEQSWPGIGQLPGWKGRQFTCKERPKSFIKLSTRLAGSGMFVLNKLLSLCPDHRYTAEEARKNHFFLDETPLPLLPEQFPKYPAKSENMEPAKSSNMKNHEANGRKRRLLHIG